MSENLEEQIEMNLGNPNCSKLEKGIDFTRVLIQPGYGHTDFDAKYNPEKSNKYDFIDKVTDLIIIQSLKLMMYPTLYNSIELAKNLN